MKSNFLRNFQKTILCFLVLVFTSIAIQKSYGQSSNAACNTYTPLVSTSFSNLDANTGSGDFNNTDRIIDADLANYASWGYFIGGSAYIEVKDIDATGTNVYPIGTYAGFVVDDNSLNILSSVTITTYLGTTVQETKSSSSLLFLDLLNGKGRIGFTTTKTFDRVRISFSALGVAGSVRVYYAEVNKPCAGPTPVCNVPTALNLPTYPAAIDAIHTGVTGVTLGSIADKSDVISSDANDYATISLPVGIFATGSISVKDQVTNYPAGYYAGFEVANASLVGVDLLTRTTITTYLNGTLQESKTQNQLLVSVPVLTGSARQTVGFITTKSFDEIQFTIGQVVGVNLGSTFVYNALVKKYCAGPDLVCNTPVAPYEPVYPVSIDGALTGINGAVCAACTISGTNKIIDNDNTTYGNITLTAGALVSGSVAVVDGFTTYPAKTYAAFDIANPNLVGVNVLSGITVSTYLNGVLQESKTGSTQLVSVTSSLLNGVGNQRVGFVSSVPFNEVRLTITQGATLNLGSTLVYNAIFEKLCAGTLPDCSTITSLTNPAYPAVLDNIHTGVSGVACVLCQVNNTANVVDNDITNYASIVLTADVLSQGSIAVLDPITDYPAGTFAGFDIGNATLIGANLLTAGKVSTYLDGVLQESTSGNLLTLTLLSASRQIIGFNTTKPFDEIKLTVGNVAGVNIGTTVVYRAVIKGASAAGNKAPVISSSILSNLLGFTNTCPVRTVNLNNAVTSTTPVGAQLVWYTTNTNPPTGAPYATPTAATEGTYYAYYYDAVKNCYSLASAAVKVTILVCVEGITESGTVTTAGGIAIDNVAQNDKINGRPATLGPSGNSTIAKSGNYPNGIDLNTVTGAVTVAPNTPIGLYPISYQLCDKSTPAVCTTVLDFVTVTTILPATGLDLIATRNSGRVQLNWSTLTEQNTSYFVVEQSTNGSTYTEAGKIAAAGSSSAKKEYQLSVKDNSLAVAYYRVKLVDLDGKEKYSNVAILRSTKASIAVYPVPAKTTLYLQTENLKGKGQVALLDLKGQQLQQLAVQFDGNTSTIKIDVSALPAGVYVMRVNYGDNNVEYRKVVIQN